MKMNDIADCLEREVAWFTRVCDARFEAYFKADHGAADLAGVCPPPDLSRDQCPYAQLVREYNMGFAERLVLMLAFMPHLRPQVLDMFLLQNAALGRGSVSYTHLTLPTIYSV